MQLSPKTLALATVLVALSLAACNHGSQNQVTPRSDDLGPPAKQWRATHKPAPEAPGLKAFPHACYEGMAGKMQVGVVAIMAVGPKVLGGEVTITADDRNYDSKKFPAEITVIAGKCSEDPWMFMSYPKTGKFRVVLKKGGKTYQFPPLEAPLSNPVIGIALRWDDDVGILKPGHLGSFFVRPEEKRK